MSWYIFGAIIILILALDLGVFHAKPKAVSYKDSVIFSSIYIAISLAFGAYIYHSMGLNSSLEYYNAFFIEKALSLDNIFVISLVFSRFKIEDRFQHRILFWGILGAIIFRLIMISLGIHIISNFKFVIYILAAFLVYTGIHSLMHINEQAKDIESSWLSKLQKKFKISNWWAALIAIEIIDITFAIDSVPVVLSITQDSFIAYSSNIFAIIGLRSLYFLLSNSLKRFKYLKYSLGFVLIFIGIKIFIHPFLDLPGYLAPVVTAILLALGFITSIVRNNK